MSADHVLTFPESASMALSIRAKALLFHDPRSVDLLEQIERIAGSDATVLVIVGVVVAYLTTRALSKAADDRATTEPAAPAMPNARAGAAA